MIRACPVCSHSDESETAPATPNARTAEEERELLAALRRSHDEAAHALEMLQEVRRQRDAALATIEAERVTAAAREHSLFELLSSSDTAQAELRRLVAQAAATPRLAAEPMVTTIVEAPRGTIPDPIGPPETPPLDPSPVEMPPEVPEAPEQPASVATPRSVTPRAPVEFAMPRPVPTRPQPHRVEPAPEPAAPEPERHAVTVEVPVPVGTNGTGATPDKDSKRSWWPRSRPHSPLDEFYLD